MKRDDTELGLTVITLVYRFMWIKCSEVIKTGRVLFVQYRIFNLTCGYLMSGE